MAVLSLRRYGYVLVAGVAATALAGCSQVPWPGSSANGPAEASAISQPQASASDLAELRTMVAADHQAIQQLAERNRQLEEEIGQLKQRPVTAEAEAAPTRLAAINQRLSKLESASSAVQSTLSRAIGRTVHVKPGDEEPVALPSYDALLDHELGLMQGEHRQQPDRQLYREGLVALRGYRWATAIDRFGVLQKRYPRSELIEPAKYFSAIALYQDGKYDQSVAQFHDFVRRYPKGSYTSTAMLSMALAYAQVKDTANARDTMKKVIAAYPGTPEATLAEATLKNLEPAPAEAHK